MTHDLPTQVNSLQTLNLSVRRKLKAVELCIPEVNEQVQALSLLGVCLPFAIEGTVILATPFLPGSSDSAQIFQAVLVMPEGLGVAVFDMEGWVRRQRDSRDEESESLVGRFRPFAECSSFAKAALLPQVDSLVERFLATIGSQVSESS